MLRPWDRRNWRAKLSEAVRRFYREIVLRRSTVRVVSATPQPLEAPPVFILAPYRSGTTLLRYVLDSHSRLCIPPETNFLCHLATLAEDPECEAGLTGLGFDRQATIAELRRTALAFFQPYAASWQKPRWGDKSPRYAEIAPFIAELFPEAQFLLLFRHGLDQAHSYSRNGTLARSGFARFIEGDEDLRVSGARYWHHVTQNLLKFRGDHPGRCHTLRYEELCAEPESTLRKVTDFIGESWENGLMMYHRHDHDVGHEDGRVAALKGFHFSGNHFLAWPRPVVEQALGVCEDSLSALGYGSGIPRGGSYESRPMR